MRIYFILILLYFHDAFCSNFWSNQNIKDKAVIIVPVADAVASPLSLLDANKPVYALYNSLSFSPDKGTNACPRLHQLIFNEVVTVKKVVGDEIQCEVANFFYYDDRGACSRTFWIPKYSICMLSNIKSKLNSIPAPYCTQAQKRCSHDLVITLAWPWYDIVTKKHYSAGTRFVHLPEKDMPNAYAVALINLSNFRPEVSFIPHGVAISSYPKNEQEGRKFLVQLIKQWIAKGIVPYVWGGCSFVDYCSEDIFSHVFSVLYGENVSYWMRPNVKKKPYTGFECSSLILRGAQICGMPYFFKNTATLSKCLRPLGVKEKLQNGDLIWYPGHVLIVSDIKNNRVIESVGYSIGYGKMHDVPLSKVFFGIKTYKELVNAYLSKKPIVRLNSKGTPAKTIENFVLFVLSSNWP